MTPNSGSQMTSGRRKEGQFPSYRRISLPEQASNNEIVMKFNNIPIIKNMNSPKGIVSIKNSRPARPGSLTAPGAGGANSRLGTSTAMSNDQDGNETKFHKKSKYKHKYLKR